MSDVFEERVLCDDGMCTGVVARDGRCGTCGRLHELAPNDDAHALDDANDEATNDEATNDEATNEATNDGAANDEAVSPEATNDETDDARELCDDGLCTGVLNADRVCGTCGRPAGS